MIMTLLTEFHKWEKEAFPYGFGERSSYRGSGNSEEARLFRYEKYLKDELKMPCEDNGTWSHWGPNAHRCEIKWNAEDWERAHPKKKPKIVTINQWLKDKYPDILKE